MEVWKRWPIPDHSTDFQPDCWSGDDLPDPDAKPVAGIWLSPLCKPWGRRPLGERGAARRVLGGMMCADGRPGEQSGLCFRCGSG